MLNSVQPRRKEPGQLKASLKEGRKVEPSSEVTQHKAKWQQMSVIEANVSQRMEARKSAEHTIEGVLHCIHCLELWPRGLWQRR